jgi:hypothetical protein
LLLRELVAGKSRNKSKTRSGMSGAWWAMLLIGGESKVVSKRTSIDTSKHNWEEELSKAMFQLNIGGLNGRYGDGEARNFSELK